MFIKIITLNQNKPMTRMIHCIEFNAMLDEDNNISLTVQKQQDVELSTYDKNALIFVLNDSGQTVDRITQASLQNDSKPISRFRSK